MCPCSDSCITAIAVNALVMEPTWKTVSWVRLDSSGLHELERCVAAECFFYSIVAAVIHDDRRGRCGTHCGQQRLGRDHLSRPGPRNGAFLPCCLQSVSSRRTLLHKEPRLVLAPGISGTRRGSVHDVKGCDMCWSRILTQEVWPG
jgi:hypothetical protein